MLAVRKAVGHLWKDREAAIKAACAPQLTDEVDVLAYLRCLGESPWPVATGPRPPTTASSGRSRVMMPKFGDS